MSSMKEKSTQAAFDQILTLKVERDDGFYNVKNYQQSESVGFLLKRGFSMMTNAIDQQLSPYDLTHPQFSILMLLKQQNCTTAAELAREASIDTGAMTRMLDRLEAKGVIARQRSTADRRVINIVLTDYGKLVVEKMPIIAMNIMNRNLQHFEKNEVSSLIKLLNKLINQPDSNALSNESIEGSEEQAP